MKYLYDIKYVLRTGTGFLLISIIIILFINNIQAELSSQYLGVKGANFLKIGTSPSVEGMGSAYVSMAEKDINSLNYNPAGLCGIQNIQFMFSTLDWIDEVSINHMAFAKPYEPVDGVISTSLTFLNLPAITHYNDWGEDIGSLDFFNLGFTVGYAHEFGNYLTGINTKLIYQKIADNNNTGFAVDLGTIYKFDPFSINVFNKYLLVIRKFNLGLAVRNLGSKAGADNLPTSIEVGYSFLILRNLHYASSIIKPVYNSESLLDSDYKMNFGLVWNFQRIFFLRTGLKTNYDIPNNFSIGFGIRTKFRSGVILVDYSYAAYTYLEKTHRVGLTFKLKDLIFWE